MVVLDQLPNVIRKNTKNGCLLTREILSFSVTDISDAVVNKHLKDEKDRELWNRLLSHWCMLKQFGSLASVSVGSLFAASMIGQDGYGLEKAAQFIEKIVNSKVVDNETENEKSEKTTFSDKMHSDSKLKASQAYQTFVSKSSKTNRLRSPLESEDEDDEINRLVVPKAMQLPAKPIVSPRSLVDHFSPAITPRTRKHRICSP
jgi:hypothetical protein